LPSAGRLRGGVSRKAKLLTEAPVKGGRNYDGQRIASRFFAEQTLPEGRPGLLPDGPQGPSLNPADAGNSGESGLHRDRPGVTRYRMWKGRPFRQTISSLAPLPRSVVGFRDCMPGPHRTVPSRTPPITPSLEGLRLSARNGTDATSDKGHDPMSGRDSPTCTATCRGGQK
jgi:hypothetical protein